LHPGQADGDRGGREVNIGRPDLLAGDPERDGILGSAAAELGGQADTEHPEGRHLGVQVHRVAVLARPLSVARRQPAAGEAGHGLSELLLVVGETEGKTGHHRPPAKISRTSETASIAASLLPANGMKLRVVQPAGTYGACATTP
jgi:hypothetical protein